MKKRPTATVKELPRLAIVPSASGRTILYSPSVILLAVEMRGMVSQQDVQNKGGKKKKGPNRGQKFTRIRDCHTILNHINVSEGLLALNQELPDLSVESLRTRCRLLRSDLNLTRKNQNARSVSLLQSRMRNNEHRIDSR